MRSQRNIRHLTISSYTDYYHTRAVPFLRIRGKWLEEAGFNINTPVNVCVESGKIVITHDLERINRIKEQEIVNLKKKLRQLERGE